jgi:transcriptional regulator with XRE-family HTH domain
MVQRSASVAATECLTLSAIIVLPRPLPERREDHKPTAASRLNCPSLPSGATPGTGSVERGERNVSIDNVERLAEALGIELADLFKRIQP